MYLLRKCKAQREDPIIGKFLKTKEENVTKSTWEEIDQSTKFKSYWSKWDLFRFCKGVRYHIWVDDGAGRRILLVLPEKFCNGALRELHDVRVAGHKGLAKTLRRIRERYYWLGQRDKCGIERLVCRRTAAGHRGPRWRSSMLEHP